MRYLILLCLLFLLGTLSAQIVQYELRGVFRNQGASEMLFLVGLVDGSRTGLETGYTAMTFLNEAGDTLVKTTNPGLWLPTREGETAVYNLPRSFSAEFSLNGSLHLQNPDTVLIFHRDVPDESELPRTDDDCENMRIKGVYASHVPGMLAFEVSTRREEQNGLWGYMSYHLENTAGDTITHVSGPSYNPPVFPSVTELFPAATIDPDYVIPPDFRGYLVTQHPFCRIPFALEELTSTDIPAPESELTVLPNPAREEVMIMTSLRGAYRLFSSDGRLLRQGRLSDERTTINLAAFPTGVLLLTVDTPAGRISRKIVRN